MSSSRHPPLIPGLDLLASGGIERGLLLLLHGPPGAGKTMYCRQFVTDGLHGGEYCIFVSHALSEKQFGSLFNHVDRALAGNLVFVNLNSLFSTAGNKASGSRLASKLLAELGDMLGTSKKAGKRGGIQKDRPVRLVVDSMVHLLMLVGEEELVRFVLNLSSILKKLEAVAILEMAATTPAELNLISRLSALADGAIEMRVDRDAQGPAVRSLRMPFLRGGRHESKWVTFEIADDGALGFVDLPAASALTCTLCGKPVGRTPLMESDLAFDSKACLETYRKLKDAYGHRIPETGLSSEILDMSFFFVDIVGLSDPTLSVKNQIQKIDMLNKLISSCGAFRKVPSERKMVLPTGDGMVIGFQLNPSLPLELGIQLHQSLRNYNRGKSPEDKIRIRIGLASGPVFTVTDLNNVLNVWGPGIILARRVMDLGDSDHILLAGNLAEDLIALSDDYRAIIKPASASFEIKHGQKIKLYSAHSRDFGNPETPSKLQKSR